MLHKSLPSEYRNYTASDGPTDGPTDDVPSRPEDCNFSVVVLSSLGDRNVYYILQLLSACGHRLSALLPILFLLVSDFAVPLQCL